MFVFLSNRKLSSTMCLSILDRVVQYISTKFIISVLISVSDDNMMNALGSNHFVQPVQNDWMVFFQNSRSNLRGVSTIGASG